MISKALLVVVRRGAASGSCNHDLSVWQPVRQHPVLIDRHLQFSLLPGQQGRLQATVT